MEDNPRQYRILITGDRNWSDWPFVEGKLRALRDYLVARGLEPVIIEGEARGADSAARDAAVNLGMGVLKFPAEWEKHKPSDGRKNPAGPIRNREMMTARPHMFVAFHDDLENSKGTKDMVKVAIAAGLKGRHFGHGVDEKLGPAASPLGL